MAPWHPDRRPSSERLATFLIAAMYLLWILSLPAWPSQDGPVHLFYTHVLAALFSQNATAYAHFFYIKHLLPPYALYYYLLLSLSRMVPLLLADRLVICAYIVIFVTGFHALARAIATPKGADRATLVATLLLLNWPLGMGFVNYCLSLALALWALALWFGPGTLLRRAVLFLLLLLAITFAHPVPLLVVLGFCAFDLLTRGLSSRKEHHRPLRADLVLLALAALPLLYVKAFAAPHLLAQRTVESGPLARALDRSAGYVQGKSLSLLFGRSLGVEIYRGALFLTLVLALGVAAWQSVRNRRNGRFTSPDLFLLAALFLLVTLPWLPSDISGAYYFPERLILLIWVFALLAAAGWQPAITPDCDRPGQSVAPQSPPWMTPLLLVFVGASSLALVISADKALRPLAVQARAWQDSRLLHGGEVVLSLESQTLPSPRRIAPSWNPWYWMAVHTIRSSDAVLANAPWLDSSIIPLAAQPTLPTAQLAPQLANSPQALTAALRLHPELAGPLVSAASAIAFSPADVPPAASPDPLLVTSQASAAMWSCQKSTDGGEQICRRVQ